MPAHTTQVDYSIVKTETGFNIVDQTTYPTGANNHRVEEWKYWLIIVEDPRGYKYLLSSHDFLLEEYNSIDSPATVATLPLIIPKKDTGVGRYSITVYGVPLFDSSGSIEDNYGADDCFAFNDGGTIKFYRVVTDVVPSVDTNLNVASKYQLLSGILSVTSRYKKSGSSFIVMSEWLECFKDKIEKAYCKIIKEPANKEVLCKDKDVLIAAELLPIKRSVLLIEDGSVSLSLKNEKKLTNLANSLCCCKFEPAEIAAPNSGTSSSSSVSSGSGPGSSEEGIGYWTIESDFVVS